MRAPRRVWPKIPPPGPAMMPGVLMADLETSGLHEGAFPIEFGWCDDSLTGSSFLIRPDPAWTHDLWSFESQEVHGIAWQTLMAEGVPVGEAVDRVDALVAHGVRLSSDSPERERAWMSRLYEAVGRRMPFAFVDDMEVVSHALLRTCGKDGAMERYCTAVDLAERAFERPHRAFPDAMCNAAVLRMALDPAWMDLVEGCVESHREVQGRLFGPALTPPPAS